MSAALIRIGVLGTFCLAASTAVADSTRSPLSWSPDGEWLCYVVVTNAGHDSLRPGWLFATTRDRPQSADRPRPSHGGQSTLEAPVYRIWATHREGRPSVMIEESRWPLTAPTWSPRGKSIAYGRFVPLSIETTQAVQRGRLEIVVQDGLDRKRVVWSIPDLALLASARSDWTGLCCSWSPDGLNLAIPRAGPVPTVEIVRTDTIKRVHILDRAAQPAWSPDGTKCAFVRTEGQRDQLLYVARHGQTFGESRQVAAAAQIPAHPYWTSDSRSILAVVVRSTARPPELDIVRYNLEPGDSNRVMSLISEPTRRTARLRGLSIDFDREAERCFFSLDLEGRDSDIVWSIPRERETHKRFHPLDQGQRIDTLAVSPDGEHVAVRIASGDGLLSPVIYDCESEQTRLLIADPDTSKDWLGALVGVAGTILQASLPPAMADGQAAARPTLLPLPGELPPQEPAVTRLNRLARFGSSLCVPANRPLDGGDPQPPNSSETEARLFFNYLRGEFLAAAADLEALEAAFDSPQDRLYLLALRAQLLWARGERTEALAVVAYLVSSGESHRQLVENTQFGLVFSPYVSPTQAWARYLSARAADGLRPDAAPPARTSRGRRSTPPTRMA